LSQPPPSPTVEFTASVPTTVVDHATRQAQGLHFWVDGTMGFHRREGGTTVISPNGGRIARHVLDHRGFNGGVPATDIEITGARRRLDHASGGPLHHDEASGLLLLFYHGESFANGDPDDFYAFIGMAVSDDDGASFADLGAIITSELAEDDPDRPHPLDVGSGAYVARDGWFLVYFHERGSQSRVRRRNLLVARARIADVVEAARERRPPRFAKYHEGQFTEPGLGGLASELIPHTALPVIWFDTAWIEALDSVLLVHSTVVAQPDGSHGWNHAAALSRDGLHWSESSCLYDAMVTDELIYLTIDSGGADQRRITDASFDVYRVRSSTRFRWDDAWLEKVAVSWRQTDGARPGA
jgi:hypothetical protein